MGKDRTIKNGNGEITKNINYCERLHPLFKYGVVKRIEHTKDKIFVEQLGGNLLAGAEVVFGAENVILSGCVETSSGIIDIEMDITPEMFIDLLPAFDEFAPCDSQKKSRRAPVIYKTGKRLFRTKRNALVRSADCILLAGAYVGVSDGNWFIHGFAQGRPDTVANGVWLTEDEARRVLYDAGYFDFTAPCDRNSANYPRPRTATRKRCPNAGQTSLLCSMGVSDD
ncbi:hypothetical protein LF599_06540 [Pseudodesulfovibrio thermohalotolerans]|uniref:hypothetical protein n=1 Tax=Pseudodesulfovibrio thermohalotolerans TaxID=2880651 RepID=UPI0024418B65|nr:hypothetical protein [Pseudodesulfovibrio thermohalotolerans]WFS63816.1 hypothetical protein LF599_06540 [Pseudodesulfovibrio thermohalotolerans]